MISIDNLSKCYLDAGENRQILNNLSLSIDQGESISIQGASGSGKSTLLHLLSALDKPNSGHIFVGGIHSDIQKDQQEQPQDIVSFTESQADQYRQKHIGLIFQKFNLIDCISVRDNVYLPANINRQIDHKYIEGLMTELRVFKHRYKLPNQLSGGEQQRVAIARALSHRPKILLADEPTGNLDSKNSDIVSQLLVESCAANNTTLIMVTHSEKVANLTEIQYRLHNGKLLTNC